MKEKYRKYKEFISVPKNKSIVQIALYGIFFIFVFIIINTHKTVNTPDVETVKEDNIIEKKEDNIKEEVISYEYIYDFNINDITTNITGTHYNYDELFTINSQKYYIKEGIIYSIDNIKQDNFEYPILRLKYSIMDTLMNNYSYETKTEYKDGTIKYEYIISNNEFGKLYNEGNINEGNVNITIIIKDYITQINMDLSTYYNVSKYLLTIKYNNINNIESLDINNGSDVNKQ